jgi:hypothetical protein
MFCQDEHDDSVICGPMAEAIELLSRPKQLQAPKIYPDDTRPSDFGIRPGDVEFITSLTLHGGAIKLGPAHLPTLLIVTKDAAGVANPVLAYVCSPDDLAKLRDWTVEVFDKTIAETAALNEERGRDRPGQGGEK